MNIQIQREIMNPINQIIIATTDKTNREYEIMCRAPAILIH
jgi:hypothetical protein